MAEILIVEDEANIRRVLHKILIDVDKNINVSEAANGVEAISMVDAQAYDLILCDIKCQKKTVLRCWSIFKKYLHNQQL